MQKSSQLCHQKTSLSIISVSGYFSRKTSVVSEICAHNGTNCSDNGNKRDFRYKKALSGNPEVYFWLGWVFPIKEPKVLTFKSCASLKNFLPTHLRNTFGGFFWKIQIFFELHQKMLIKSIFEIFYLMLTFFQNDLLLLFGRLIHESPNLPVLSGTNYRELEGNQNKNNCLVSNFYNKLKSPALFSHLFRMEKSAENFNLF